MSVAKTPARSRARDRKKTRKSQPSKSNTDWYGEIRVPLNQRQANGLCALLATGLYGKHLSEVAGRIIDRRLIAEITGEDEA